jgi:hypothetical protein
LLKSSKYNNKKRAALECTVPGGPYITRQLTHPNCRGNALPT